MSLNLTQIEADELMAMQKRLRVEDSLQFPQPGEKLIIELQSVDRTEDFLLDVTRSRIDFSKINYQNRAQVVIILKRLDLNGAPHRNPDGQIIPCPHMHTYREGYGDKWAEPVSAARFVDLNDMPQTLSDFMIDCNVVQLPIVQPGLF